MSAKPLNKLVDELPKSNMTTRMLHMLDWVAPGQWTNLTGFENTVKTISGEDDPKLIQKIGTRALELYNDKSQGYQRALWLYQTVDFGQGALGAAALTNLVGEKVNFLSFLNKITPKSENTQLVDFCVKLVVELVAFCYINGIPGDSVMDFVKSLTNIKHEAKMRMAGLICIDGLLPLGPEYLSKALGMINSMGAGDLAQNEKFKRVASLLPGNDTAGQLSFLQTSMGSVKDWMNGFVQQTGATSAKIAGNLKGWVDFSEDKLDFLAAFIDMTTNYYEHTGTQTVARQVINRALAEV